MKKSLQATMLILICYYFFPCFVVLVFFCIHYSSVYYHARMRQFPKYYQGLYELLRGTSSEIVIDHTHGKIIARIKRKLAKRINSVEERCLDILFCIILKRQLKASLVSDGGRRGGLMVIALDSGSSGPGLSLGRGTALCS